MGLTTFDPTFDFTFARAGGATVVLPPVGGDGSTPGAGGAIAGAVLPFAKRLSLLPAGRPLFAQEWDDIGIVPRALPGFLPPFAVAIIRPDDIKQTPWCEDGGKILDAKTGNVVDTFTTDIVRRVSKDLLYLIQPTGSLQLSNGGVLQPGRYQALLGDTSTDYRISDVFEVVSNPCSVYRIRLSNLTPIGKLPYGTDNFEQIFYVPGDLTGPTFEETETNSGGEKTGGTVTRIWTLELSDVTESIAEALSLVGLHRLVEVDILAADGTIARPIQAMAYRAKAKINQIEGGAFDIELILPVEVVSWSQAAAGCLVDDTANDLLLVECGPVSQD